MISLHVVRTTRITVALALLALTACGSTTATTPTPATGATSAATAAGTTNPAPSQSVSCSAQSSASSPASTKITALTVAGDVVTVTFDQGTPAYTVAGQGTSFQTDPAGTPVTVKGTAGVKIVFSGLQPSAYGGANSFSPAGSELVDFKELGDNGGTVGFAAGLQSPGCAATSEGNQTLTFTFSAG